MAHELCHAVVNNLNFPALELAVEEGVCQLWSYMYLQRCIKKGYAKELPNHYSCR